MSSSEQHQTNNSVAICSNEDFQREKNRSRTPYTLSNTKMSTTVVGWAACSFVEVVHVYMCELRDRIQVHCEPEPEPILNGILKPKASSQSPKQKPIPNLILQNVHNSSCSIALCTSFPCCGCGWPVLLPRLCCAFRGRLIAAPAAAPAPSPAPSPFRATAVAYPLCRTPHSFKSFAIEWGRDIDVDVLAAFKVLNFAAVGETDKFLKLAAMPIGVPTTLLRTFGVPLRGCNSLIFVEGSRSNWRAVRAINASFPALCILHVRSGSTPTVRRRFVSERVDPGWRGCCGL